MQRFAPSEYYSSEEEEFGYVAESDNDNVIITLLPPSGRLIAEYYHDKHGTVITVSQDKEYVHRINDYLTDLRKTSGDYRHAFSFGFGLEHAVPIIYIKEGSQEGILVADSKGDTETASIIQKITGINVYTIANPRQSDSVSCHLDSIIFGRTATAKDPNTQKYLVPNLLTRLHERSENKEKYFETKLTDDFLKTAQISGFVALHAEEEKKIIHLKHDRKETLQAFRERHELKLREPLVIEVPDRPTKIVTKIAGYNRRKAVKIANIIEIQFYIEQLKSKLGAAWTSEMKSQFVKQAKEILKEQGPPKASRIGLFEFANKMLNAASAKEEKEYKRKAETPKAESSTPGMLVSLSLFSPGYCASAEDKKQELKTPEAHSSSIPDVSGPRSGGMGA